MRKNTVSNNFFLSGYILFLALFVAVALLFAYIGRNLSDLQDNSSINSSSDATLPTIIIDAGHGGEDGGTVGCNGVYEKDINLDISLTLRDIFISCNYNVVLTREEDKMLYDPNSNYKGRKKALDLSERVKIANSYENAIFISIHMNAFPEEQYSGLQVYYSKNSPSSQILADNVQSLICEKIQQSNDRQIKQAGSNIFVLDRISRPAILIECGFLSNREECALLCDESYRQKLSFSIFSAVTKYLHTPT